MHKSCKKVVEQKLDQRWQQELAHDEQEAKVHVMKT